MYHIDTLGFSGSSGPSGLSRRANSAVPSGSTDRLSAGSDLGRSGARSGSTALRGLSDRELLSRVKDLVARERAVTLEVLVHLIEVERRRLHVELGYASMFDYCTRHLQYSSSSAARRIQTARCLRDYPEVLPPPREERSQPEHGVPGLLDPHERELQRHPRTDPEEVPERGRRNRGRLSPSGVSPGPGETGVGRGPVVGTRRVGGGDRGCALVCRVRED